MEPDIYVTMHGSYSIYIDLRPHGTSPTGQTLHTERQYSLTTIPLKCLSVAGYHSTCHGASSTGLLTIV